MCVTANGKRRTGFRDVAFSEAVARELVKLEVDPDAARRFGTIMCRGIYNEREPIGDLVTKAVKWFFRTSQGREHYEEEIPCRQRNGTVSYKYRARPCCKEWLKRH